jgi:hypothetical protein
VAVDLHPLRAYLGHVGQIEPLQRRVVEIGLVVGDPLPEQAVMKRAAASRLRRTLEVIVISDDA